MSTPSFTVSHVTSKDDFPDIVAVEKKAFGASQLTSLIYSPDPNSPENIANMVHNHQRAWLSDPNAKYLKAETPEGKIIGMAKWYFFLDSTAKDNPWVIELPPNANEAPITIGDCAAAVEATSPMRMLPKARRRKFMRGAFVQGDICNHGML